jgi:hypothetical protein
MDTCNSTLAASYWLTEQVARQISEILPEQGPIIVIMDKDGNCWPSSSEEFSRLNVTESLLRDLCARVDDGAEPVMTQASDASITAAQLATERTNCGYVLIALPRHSPEAALINTDLIETLLNQITLVAKLIEQNNQLYELQMKQYKLYARGEQPSN